MRTRFSETLLAPDLQRLSYRCAWVLYGLIVVLGSVPGARADIGEYAPGVVLHALAYGTLAAVLFVGSRGDRRARAVKAALTVFAMGAGDEYVQSFLPYRSASVGDWLVDAIAGSAVSMALRPLWPQLPSGPGKRYPPEAGRTTDTGRASALPRGCGCRQE